MTIRVVAKATDVAAAAWDACANPPDAPRNPFVAHAFFRTLEESGSAVRKTGWLPRHLVLEDEMGHVRGIAPAYVKSHSQGEYVFDHSWADAFERAGGRYYPKLQTCVPFTPVTGPRLLAADPASRDALAQGLRAVARETGTSSSHITFLPHDDWQRLGNEGWLRRTDTQFHWLNKGYASFEDFLADLASRKRKNIRKERDTVRDAGITCEWVTGASITEAHWDAFFDFYMDTGSRKWGRPYLTRDFFSRIGDTMADAVLLIMCCRAGRIIAGALNFIGSDALYGRNWGAVEHHPCLHFEACYYQAIEFAIEHKLARVEAGAQGPHKLSRGYVPQATYSLHYLSHPGLARAVGDYLEQERREVAGDQAYLARHAPFRHDDESDF